MITWKRIPDYLDYEASNQGTIRNYSTKKILNIHTTSMGYRTVNVKNSSTGKWKNQRIYRLVGYAFLGPKPDGMGIRHLNGNSLDDNLTNLEYGTQEVNMQDKMEHGTSMRGEKHPNCKLNCKDLRKLFKLRESGKFSQRALGKIFGVTQSHICLILSGHNRKYDGKGALSS